MRVIRIENMNDFADCSIHTPPFSLQGFQAWARVVDIYDGDTLTVVMRAPADKFHKFHVRIAGIDTAEMKEEKMCSHGLACMAKMEVVRMITGRQTDTNMIKHRKDMVKLLEENIYLVEVDCGPFDKYGRLLANVRTSDGVNIGPTLMEGGLANAYDGGKKQKFEAVDSS